MKQIIKKGIVKIFDPVAKKLGYVPKHTITSANYDSDLLHNFFLLLKAISFDPKHIVDIGANHGTWTRQALLDFPDCRYTLLEPQSQLKESIQDILDTNSNVSFYAVGAGKKSGTFDFTIVDRDDSCTFKYSAEEAKEKNYTQIKVPVVTLNEFIKEQNLPIPDIIKIDAEGIDIEVMEGANEFFGKTEIFMVEAGIVYKGFENSFLNVINFMDKNGYRLFDITQLNKPFNPPVLWLTELAFVKKNGIIDSHKWVFQ